MCKRIQKLVTACVCTACRLMQHIEAEWRQMSSWKRLEISSGADRRRPRCKAGTFVCSPNVMPAFHGCRHIISRSCRAVKLPSASLHSNTPCRQRAKISRHPLLDEQPYCLQAVQRETVAG